MSFWNLEAFLQVTCSDLTCSPKNFFQILRRIEKVPMMIRGDTQKKKRDFLGIFPKRGGGSFQIPIFFVNLPSVFLSAKNILRCQNMFYNSGEVISDQFHHITLDSKSGKF